MDNLEIQIISVRLPPKTQIWSHTQAIIFFFLIAIMNTEIDYDDDKSTIGMLPMVKTCPNVYNLRKLQGIINKHLTMIPST